MIPTLRAALLLVLSAVFAAACAPPPDLPPWRVVEDAHLSGSRVAVDPSGERVASAGLDGVLAVWDTRSGSELARWKGHEGTVNGLCFLSARRLVSGAWDGRLALWSLQGRLLRERRTDSPVTALVPEEGTRAFWSGHRDGSLRRWSPALQEIRRLRLPGGHRVTALAWHAGRLAAADRAGNLWLFEPDGGAPRLLARLNTHLRDLAFDDRGRLFGGTWFRLHRWDPETGAHRALETEHFGILQGLAWDPRRKLLLTISRQTDSSVLALDPETGATRIRFGRHDLCGADVALGNGVMATTSDDGSVRLWRLPPAGR